MPYIHSLAHPASNPGKEEKSFKRGELIHHVADDGPVWRVVEGAVRLDLHDAEGMTFASLALPGDMLGLESLVFGHYGFTARALTPCVLALRAADDPAPLAQMAATTRRAAQVVALRSGRAAERVQRLVQLLTDNGARPLAGKRRLLPRLADIAEITDLTVETVCRTTAGLDTEGGLPHRTRQKPGQSRAPQLLAA
ncbi:MAG: cyclic nucleotide-binding domain-containing protein [Rugosibacter sp.]|nr:cyclic nucleotide-binding domain-containing protein [Rugosibacter sp.]